MYAMIYVFFTLFPATQQYSQMLLSTSLDWLKKLVGILFDLLKFAVAGFFLYLAARILWAIVDMIFRHYEENPNSTRIPDAAISPLKRLFKALIVMSFVIALVAVIPGPGEYLAFGLFLLAGVFIGISALPYISGIFAGLAMLLARKIKIGDKIRIDEIEGKVDMIGIVWTRIVTDDNREIVFFNSKIIQAPILIQKEPENDNPKPE
jgi:small-conductance mechanosensitive channel